MAAATAQARSNLVGIGLTPEAKQRSRVCCFLTLFCKAIDTNPIIYEFMMEFTWTDGSARDVDAWVAGWAQRRYGLSAPNSDAAA